jgi:hypothetical protein
VFWERGEPFHYVLSTDEKTGIQAIERDHPTLPAQPGPTHEGLERREHNYQRQVELWFSILTRRLLKRGSFDSVQTLQERIERFIEFFNNTMAKPFKWTYSGHALTA